MRWAVLSDIHANLPALRAALDTLEGASVDGYICAGDLVGYGPHPNECVETMAELGALCVAGNHELMLLGRLPEARGGTLVRATLDWTRATLHADARRYIGALPLVREVPPFIVAHGSLDDPQRYVRTAQEARDVFARLRSPTVDLIVLGHTHRPALFREGHGAVRLWPSHRARLPASARHLVNPGSIGQSRQWERRPLVRFAVVDTKRRSARWYAIPYDHRPVVADLRRLGISSRAIHLQPKLRHALVHRVRRVLR